MWSMPVVLTEWENDLDSQNQWESLRITINTMIFRHQCHLALDHWRGRTLFFFCYLCDSQWRFVEPLQNFFRVILWWFLAIPQWFTNHSEISLGQFSVIPIDYQWFVNHSEISLGWFLVIHKPLLKFHLGDSQQFLVIHKRLWNFFGAILSDSWWFSVIHKKFWNFFGVILGDFGWFSKNWNFSGAILRWFANHSEISLGQFSMILGNSWWFVNHSKISLGWFLVICEPVWNFFGVILSDLWNNSEISLGWFSLILGNLQTTLKFLSGDSQ